MRARVHHIIYIVLLCILAVGLPTSNFLMNMGWVLLLVNWLAEWDMKAKWQKACQSRLLQAFVCFYLLHVAGLVWSGDLLYGLDDLRKKLPMLVLPLVMLTTPAVSTKERHWVLLLYVCTVAVTTVIGLVRWLTIDDLAYRDIIPFISHIRFSLNLSFCVCLMAVALWRGISGRRGFWAVAVPAVLMVWFVLFLLLLQSFTGVVALAVGSLVALLVAWRREGLRRVRAWLLACWVALLGVVALVVWHNVDSYFRLQPLSQGQPQQCTAKRYTSLPTSLYGQEPENR